MATFKFPRDIENTTKTTDAPTLKQLPKQTPHTLYIGCSDSRVLPHRLMNAGIGDIFTHENIGGIVPPMPPASTKISHDLHSTTALHTSVSPAIGTWSVIEYAVKALNVRNIVVAGHTHCGGMAALYGGSDFPYVNQWVKHATPAKERVIRESKGITEEALLRKLEQESVLNSIENLRKSLWIQEREEQGSLTLLPLLYNLEEQRLYSYDKGNDKWQRMVENENSHTTPQLAKL